jgi:Holliday junction resolvasome RuvABC ATP-dependent DNA helicase subunit
MKEVIQMALEPIKIGTQGLDAKTKKIIEIIAADEENRKYEERCSGQKSISDVYQKSAQRAAENKEPGLLERLVAWVKSFF